MINIIISPCATAGVWTAPQTTGERPPPCAHFSLTAIDSNRAVMFGGSNEEQDYNNDTFIIDLRTMVCLNINYNCKSIKT